MSFSFDRLPFQGLEAWTSPDRDCPRQWHQPGQFVVGLCWNGHEKVQPQPCQGRVGWHPGSWWHCSRLWHCLHSSASLQRGLPEHQRSLWSSWRGGILQKADRCFQGHPWSCKLTSDAHNLITKPRNHCLHYFFRMLPMAITLQLWSLTVPMALVLRKWRRCWNCSGLAWTWRSSMTDPDLRMYSILVRMTMMVK